MNMEHCNYILKDGSKHKGLLEAIRYMVDQAVEEKFKAIEKADEPDENVEPIEFDDVKDFP